MTEEEEQEDDLHKQQQFLDALGVFVNKYEPAKKNEVTDYFSSLEIIGIIQGHTGITMNMMELHRLMQQMGYQYDMQQQQFMWQCCKRG